MTITYTHPLEAVIDPTDGRPKLRIVGSTVTEVKSGVRTAEQIYEEVYSGYVEHGTLP